MYSHSHSTQGRFKKSRIFSTSENTPPLSKKAKKALKQAQHAHVGSHSNVVVDYGDQLALNRRAERFQREHELERMKQLRVASAKVTNGRAGSMFTNGDSADEPEADPVSYCDGLV